MDHNNEQNLLQDLEQEMYLEPVSRWTRLGNLIIDSIIIYVITQVIDRTTNYLIWFIPDYDETFRNNFVWQIIGISLVVNMAIKVVYYTIFESATAGRTLGKMVTGTVAVKDNGQPITGKEAFLRSLCRLIPFNSLSALFADRPWHDSIPGTMVVKKR